MTFVCTHIVEMPGIVEYFKKRSLYKQYIKAKKHLLDGNFDLVDFRKRKPHTHNVWYLKLNKKYRVLGVMDGSVFKVIDIDDHQ